MGGIALLIGTAVGVLLGILAALNKGKWPDQVIRVVAILGTTIPVFVLISLFQLFFAVKMQQHRQHAFYNIFCHSGVSFQVLSRMGKRAARRCPFLTKGPFLSNMSST